MEKDLKMKLSYVLTVLCGCLLIFVFFKILFLSGNIISISVMYDIGNEVRDFVSFRLTQYILEGKNPYRLDQFSESPVPFLLLYTGLNPFLSAGISKITGFSITTGYYIGNILLLLLTAVNIWIIIKDIIPDMKPFVFLCTLINTCTFFSFLGMPIFNFHTDSIGIFVTSLIILVINKNKNQTLLLSVLTVMLIFTKQILIILALPVFLFYLFYGENKLAFRYLMECMICGLITIFLVQWLFPLYWTETIFAQFIVSKTYGSFSDAIWNIIHFYYRYFMDGILILISIIILIKNQKNLSIISAFREISKHHQFIVYLSLNLTIGTLFLLYFAKCDGDGYKYCQDLLALSLYLITVFFWYRIFGSEFSHSCNTGMFYRFLAAALAVSAVINYSHFETVYYTKDDVHALMELESDINTFKGEMMYLGLNSTQYIISNDLWDHAGIDFNDGQIGYFIKDYPQNEWLKALFFSDEIESAAKAYVNRVNQKTADQQYSLITTCLDSLINPEILRANYYPFKTYGIKTEANGIYDVTLWLPR